MGKKVKNNDSRSTIKRKPLSDRQNTPATRCNNETPPKKKAKANLDDSFDCLPEWVSNSPPYKYQRDAVSYSRSTIKRKPLRDRQNTLATRCNNETPPKKKAKANLDDSFDCLPEWISNSPPYKYQRDAVRKKSERAALPGQACPDCFAFYEKYDEDTRKKMLDSCSRHRMKWTRSTTPPGIWDVTFPDTDSD